MEKYEPSAGEYGDEMGMHHSPDEVVEALDMLSRLHRGDLEALIPELHYRHLRGRLPQTVHNASGNRLTAYPPWCFSTKLGPL